MENLVTSKTVELPNSKDLASEAKLFPFDGKSPIPDFEYALAVGLSRTTQQWDLIQIVIGTQTHVRLDLKLLTQRLCNDDIGSLILCHNHPSGDPEPSRHDFYTTSVVAQICQAIDTRFQDHIIFGRNRLFSFRSAGHL